MRTLTVLTAGVSLVFGLHAAGGQSRAAISVALASVDRNSGDYEGAERVLRAAVADQSSGTQEERAMLMVGLTDLLREEARETEAFAVLNEANQLTGLPRDIRTDLLMETGELTCEMGLWSQSITAWNQIGELANSEHSTQLEAIYTLGLGETWFNAGNLTRAEPLLRRSLQLLRDDPGAPASQLATALAIQARLYIYENKLALAEQILDEAVAKDEASFDPGHPQNGLLLEMRAEILSRRGEAQAAREDLERARVIMSNHFGAESIEVAGVLAALGDVEQRAGHMDLAAGQYRLAMRITGEAGRDGARLRNAVAVRYAAALKAARKFQEAKAVLAEGTSQSFRDK